VRDLLADEGAKQKARALQREFARWDGAEKAAAFLSEQFGDPLRPAAIPLTPYTAKRL
jgi:hypothetical protein